MKLKVIIHRQRDYEPCAGTLRAYIEQGGRLGEDLLGRNRFKEVDAAVQAVDAVIMKKYKLLEAPEIEYVIDDIEKPA